MVDQKLSNGIPAEITMETKSNQLGEISRFLFEDTGRVVYLNDSYYIRYDEKQEDESIPVTIKINPDGHVVLIRQGEVTNRMVFDVDEPTYSNYKTPAGILEIKVQTDDLKISYYDRPFAGRLNIDYRLYVGDQHLGDFGIRLKFTT